MDELYLTRHQSAARKQFGAVGVFAMFFLSQKKKRKEGKWPVRRASLFSLVSTLGKVLLVLHSWVHEFLTTSSTNVHHCLCGVLRSALHTIAFN